MLPKIINKKEVKQMLKSITYYSDAVNVLKNKNNICALGKKYNGGCFSLKSLSKIHNHIFGKQEKGKKQLITNIENYYKDCGKNHGCWLNKKEIKKINDDEIQKNTFLTIGPNKKNFWLSNEDENNIFEQVEKSFKSFKFYEAIPLDFAFHDFYKINYINFDELKQKKIDKIATIINLDKLKDGGSHWVSLFANLKKNQIYFYDGVGRKYPKQVGVLMDKIEGWMLKKSTKVDRKYNIKQHQNGNGECGIYCVNYIFRMIEGENFEYFCNNKICDECIET